MSNKMVLMYIILGLTVGPFVRAATLEERVAELEAQSTLNYIKFGGSLETFYDSITSEQDVGGALDDHTQYLRMRASVNADADVSKRIKVYSRFTASKFFSQGDPQGAAQSPAPSDLEAGRKFQGTELYLEKGYADIIFNKSESSSSVFSMGRLPTIDGPPINYKYGKERIGTYPVLGYNAIFDGFALTHSRELSESEITFRYVYAPFTSVNLGDTATGGVTPPYLSRPTAGGNSHSNMFGINTMMIEWDKKNLPIASKMNIMAQTGLSDKLNVDGTLLGGTGATRTAFQVSALALSLSEVAGTKLDFIVSASTSKLDNEGVITVGPASLYGLMADKEGDSVTGSAMLAAVRYRLDSVSWIGAEYLDAKKGVFIPAFATDDLSSFYQTVGQSYDIYGIYKPMNEVTLRIGYSQQNHDYSGFALGAIAKSDRTVETIYARARVDY